MAALSHPNVLVVRAAHPGEGREISSLWRELWDLHEGWGGYAGSHEPRVYDRLAARLDQDARVRGGQPVLGRHVHLVAAMNGRVVGQVEGWFERHGIDPTTPFTCEVRSLIVSASARASGAGRELLDALASSSATLGRGGRVVLAAEVLEPNPAHGFYTRVGYRPVSWCARIDVGQGRAPGKSAHTARLAEPRDALEVALLESTLASRRRAMGDVRFDRPRAIDATFVGAIAAHLAHGARVGAGDAASLARGAGLEPRELVVTDGRGAVRASASFAVNTLEPPFVPMRRAMLGRFAVDQALAPGPLVAPLIALAERLALERGARALELTDLPPPASPLHEAVLAAGARPWSRVVVRMAPVR